MTNTPLFLFGNGLSMALSKQFSLKNITEKFLSELKGVEKEFLAGLCGGIENLNFDDFEENFSKLEDAYNSAIKYNHFIKSNVGEKFLRRFKLPEPHLNEHITIIKSVYNKYIFQILTIIRDKVRKDAIREKLKDFTAFLKVQLQNKGYVFTLNYDLLAEAIMLEEIGTEKFTDFCCKAHCFEGTKIDKFDFDPAMSEHHIGDELTNLTELHHLHGSLSLFYDYKRNKAIKFRKEDILDNNVYETISLENWPLYPAIITGGGKSLKMNEYPFEFYFRRFKELSTYGRYSKLFIVGYSFRDEHINDMIKRWMKAVKEYDKGLLIIDFKNDKTKQEDYKKFVRSKIKKIPEIPDTCFEFGGANKIRDVQGTEVVENTFKRKTKRNVR